MMDTAKPRRTGGRSPSSSRDAASAPTKKMRLRFPMLQTIAGSRLEEMRPLPTHAHCFSRAQSHWASTRTSQAVSSQTTRMPKSKSTYSLSPVVPICHQQYSSVRYRHVLSALHGLSVGRDIIGLVFGKELGQHHLFEHHRPSTIYLHIGTSPRSA